MLGHLACLAGILGAEVGWGARKRVFYVVLNWDGVEPVGKVSQESGFVVCSGLLQTILNCTWVLSPRVWVRTLSKCMQVAFFTVFATTDPGMGS